MARQPCAHAGIRYLSAAADQLQCLRTHWLSVCEEASLGSPDRDAMWGRQFLNPYALQGYDER